VNQEEILQKVTDFLGDRLVTSGEHAGRSWAVVPREHILETLAFMKNAADLSFDFLVDITVVDHLHLELDDAPERFSVIHELASHSLLHRFRIKTPVPEDDPCVPSAMPIWEAARWGEREAHDMFGVVFEGNPDLRRLLMPANYVGYPLRKDYPLRGRGERETFEQVRKSET